jgi:hypothetical protein
MNKDIIKILQKHTTVQGNNLVVTSRLMDLSDDLETLYLNNIDNIKKDNYTQRLKDTRSLQRLTENKVYKIRWNNKKNFKHNMMFKRVTPKTFNFVCTETGELFLPNNISESRKQKGYYSINNLLIIK